ncbi:MAG: efflux RND transporter periplasmic adaptor subunit [Armatimonadetes bacterium]|nr:efflux RND transporter periplasmic adaptor subunit [Armatimonadota bacterium]
MKIKTLFIVILTALAAVSIYSFTKSSADSQPQAAESHATAGGHTAGDPHAEGDHHEEEAKPALEIADLRTARAVAGEGWTAVVATGRVAIPPDRLVKVGPRIEGKVVSVYGTVGDPVARGQTLAVISSVELAEARARYRQALGRLNATRDNYAREARIVRLGAVSVRPVEEARTESLSVQGEIADAQSEILQARSELVREESELAQCQSRLQRARELYSEQIVSRQDLESAEAEYRRDAASVESAKLKVSQAQSRVEKARAKMEITRQYLGREEKIHRGGLLDRRAMQTAKAEIASARLEAQAAADRIRVLGANPSGSGDTIVVTSPIAGRILTRDTNIGAMVTPSDVLFAVADQSRVWVEADVYEKDLAKIRAGQSAEIRAEAYPEKVFRGKVETVSDTLSLESRTAKVRCAVDNARGLLKGEMFARVSLVTGRRGRTVLVPKEAVLDDGGSKIVMAPCTDCAEDKGTGKSSCGSFDRVVVKVGPAQGNWIEILSGLKPDNEVVTTGAYQIKAALGSGKLEAGCADGH